MMMMMASSCLMGIFQMMRGLWKKRCDTFLFNSFYFATFFEQVGGKFLPLLNTHTISQEGGDPEKLKLRQKLKAREWDELMSTKKKMKVLEPVVRGCVWEGEGPGLQLFQPYAVCLVEPLPKADTSPSQQELSHRCQREEQRKCV